VLGSDTAGVGVAGDPFSCPVTGVPASSDRDAGTSSLLSTLRCPFEDGTSGTDCTNTSEVHLRSGGKVESHDFKPPRVSREKEREEHTLSKALKVAEKWLAVRLEIPQRKGRRRPDQVWMDRVRDWANQLLVSGSTNETGFRNLLAIADAIVRNPRFDMESCTTIPTWRLLMIRAGVSTMETVRKWVKEIRKAGFLVSVAKGRSAQHQPAAVIEEADGHPEGDAAVYLLTMPVEYRAPRPKPTPAPTQTQPNENECTKSLGPVNQRFTYSNPPREAVVKESKAALRATVFGCLSAAAARAIGILPGFGGGSPSGLPCSGGSPGRGFQKRAALDMARQLTARFPTLRGHERHLRWVIQDFSDCDYQAKDYVQMIGFLPDGSKWQASVWSARDVVRAIEHRLDAWRCGPVIKGQPKPAPTEAPTVRQARQAAATRAARLQQAAQQATWERAADFDRALTAQHGITMPDISRAKQAWNNYDDRGFNETKEYQLTGTLTR
jgi:hypothetical protein